MAFRGDAAFAKPELYESVLDREAKYAIRLPAKWPSLSQPMVSATPMSSSVTFVRAMAQLPGRMQPA